LGTKEDKVKDESIILERPEAILALGKAGRAAPKWDCIVETGTSGQFIRDFLKTQVT
jgi:hypothetical protein